jgi:signal transduction histidine kinase
VLLLLRFELWPIVGGLVLLSAATRHGLIVTSALAALLWWMSLGLALRGPDWLMPWAEELSLVDLLAAERDLALMAVMACTLAVALEQERRLSTWALARARELEALVRALPDLVLRLDAEGRIVDYRAGTAEDSPVDPARFLGRRLSELLPDPVKEMFAQAMARAREALEPVQFDYVVDAPSGQQRHFEARLSALGDGCLVVILRDVSERARAEQELRAHAQALARSNAELQQFAYIASHDLQEPLRTVAGFCELLQRRYGDRLDDTGREFIAFAVDGARRMQSLVRDLLDLSRIATRGRPFAPVDCSQLLERVLADLRGALAETGGRVEIGPLPEVSADAAQLAQLFANLIGNALKYRGPAPPRVQIWAERKDAGHLFHVKDNGIGIAPEFHEQIFEPFRRLHTRDEYPGNGIGLAICRKIVDRHGGWIRVESTPGQGSDFQFWLPDRPVEPERLDKPPPGGAAAVPDVLGQ